MIRFYIRSSSIVQLAMKVIMGTLVRETSLFVGKFVYIGKLLNVQRGRVGNAHLVVLPNVSLRKIES